MDINSANRALQAGQFDETLKKLYPRFEEDADKYKNRISSLLESYREHFGDTEEIHLFSAPGRIEVGGNHTDHQHGNVLAAAIDRDMLAAAALNGSDRIRVFSIGYGGLEIGLDDLEPREDEKESTASLVRGVTAEIKKAGYAVQGFNVCITSDVPGGSGISSSAAFEVLIGSVLNGLFCGNELSPVTLAKIGQYAEQHFFGKPSGLMDQTASAVGGFVAIDFKDTAAPVIRAISPDKLAEAYSIFVIDTGSAHADLSNVYAGIPIEMRKAAAFFGKEVLREVDEEEFWKQIAQVRKQTGDRAVLRAVHYFEENQRAVDEAAALEQNDIDGFLQVVKSSANSSFIHLQNVIISGQTEHQDVAYALAVAEHALAGRGAVRVHGGGFAGTILAFVPADAADAFRKSVEDRLFPGACTRMSIRPIGCAQVF